MPRTLPEPDKKVFVIGRIGYDFGSESRLDYFAQLMGSGKSPTSPAQMAEYLGSGDAAKEAVGLIWIVKVDNVPVFAIEPEGPLSEQTYRRLVVLLSDQEKNVAEYVSFGGSIAAEVRLFNGQIVPKVRLTLRGIYQWKLSLVADSVNSEQKSEMNNFLNRLYYELRNHGISSGERALNFAATHAYQMKQVFIDMINGKMHLNKISVERSPISRPDADCWDVVMAFFNPNNRMTQAQKLYRYTVDVSGVEPVTVGKMRSWFAD